jgi:hypothetical protein
VYQMQAVAKPEGKLARAREVVIQMPADGSIRDAVYAASGRDCAEALRQSFSSFATKVSVVDCQAGSCNSGAGYFVVPQILSWEDRATAWSGNLDRVTMKVTITDAATGAPVSVHVLLASGTLSVRIAQELLPTLTTQFVQSLY